MNKVHYNVTGLQNAQMKTQLKNSLSDLDGVQMVNVDLTEGSVEVAYNEPTSEEVIRSGIEQVGCRII